MAPISPFFLAGIELKRIGAIFQRPVFFATRLGFLCPGIPYRTIRYRVFSHDVTAATLVFQNNETAAMLVYQTNPVGVELFSHLNTYFYSDIFAWLLVT